LSKSAGAGSFTVTRNAANGLPKFVSVGALSLTRAFNGYGEVEGQDYTVNSTSLTSWSLTRDDTGRITQKQETVDGLTSTYVYSYDPMGRLMTVTKDGALVEEYEYGSNGARTSEMNVLRGITSRTMTYSDEDHLLTAGGTTYQYDADGFLVTKTRGTDVTQYFYSSRGELLQVVLPEGKTIDYLHDPLGRRIAKLVDGTITEKYLWQGLTQLLAVYDGSDNLIMRSEYADDRMPAAIVKGGATYYLTYNQVGSLRVISDASGNVVKRIDHDSFGNIINDNNPSFTIPFGFAGGLYDQDTGLVRFGFRDYDPDIGRWTAKDPIQFVGGDTDLYGYCMNDPVNWMDSLGLQHDLSSLFKRYHYYYVYSQSAGTLTGHDRLTGEMLFYYDKAYSGKDEAKNNPAWQFVKDMGPLPRGWFKMGPGYYHKRKGYSMNLNPIPCYSEVFDPYYDPFGYLGDVRSGFMIHADKISAPGTASTGCLVIPSLKLRQYIGAHRGLLYVTE